MQLVLENGKVIATHDDNQDIANLYPDCEIIHGDYGSPLEHITDTEVKERFDPRTNEEKTVALEQATQQASLEARREAYPPIEDQLDMIYWDQINNTQVWLDTITSIKNAVPKPIQTKVE
jgi:hypothetical protein